jgi:hypothetical protein
MGPRERRETNEQNLFRSRLDQIIGLNHALVKLARVIDWRAFWRSGSERNVPIGLQEAICLGGLAILGGSSALKRKSQYQDPAFRKFLRPVYRRAHRKRLNGDPGNDIILFCLRPTC